MASEFGFTDVAYGTYVALGSTVQSGPSALVSLGNCTSALGISKTNTAASVSLPPLLTSGTINTRVASETTPTGIASTSSATTQQISALNGLVTATEVKSVATTSHNTATGLFSVSSAGTTFTSLVVAGHPITATPAPNTAISLPGIGFVVLNQQTADVGTSSASLRVIGIHIVVTLSNPLVPPGTQIIVSNAFSGLTGPVSGLLTGLAYGTYANVGTTVIAGTSFPEYLPCIGTGGVTKSNSGVSVSIPGLLSSGTVTNTAQGISSSTQVLGHTSSTVQNLNLLAGRITVTTIKASVYASGNPPAFSDASSFVGLQVAGFPAINDNVAPNTKLTLLPGITLYLHRQVKTANSITVIMLQLVVTGTNSLGLVTGTTVNVAAANVGVV